MSGARTDSAPIPSPAPGAVVDVGVVSDEADAALTILQQEQRGESVVETDWARLFSSEGYRRLKARELSLRRAFSDSAFRGFLKADTLIRRTPELVRALPRFRELDIASAARQALRYLPGGARIKARLYPEIKPQTNTFVYGFDSIPGIFMYVEGRTTAAKLANTLTHELHHIGYGTVCDAAPDTMRSKAVQMLEQRIYGFGEGLAMLAAAGSADIHPHAVSDTTERNRWDRDVANVAPDVHAMQQFFLDVLDGRITDPDSVLRVANSYYGVQGPWYTVGWVMASTIERAMGRPRLLEVMCSPAKLMGTYNAAAATLNRRNGSHLPIWGDDLIRKLSIATISEP